MQPATQLNKSALWLQIAQSVQEAPSDPWTLLTVSTVIGYIKVW